MDERVVKVTRAHRNHRAGRPLKIALEGVVSRLQEGRGAADQCPQVTNRRLVLVLACAMVALGGCATTLGTNEGSASPASASRSPSDFGSSTTPNFGPQLP
jgi:hypothetical protein